MSGTGACVQGKQGGCTDEKPVRMCDKSTLNATFESCV